MSVKFLVKIDGTTNTLQRLQTKPAANWGKGGLGADFKAFSVASDLVLPSHCGAIQSFRFWFHAVEAFKLSGSRLVFLQFGNFACVASMAAFLVDLPAETVGWSTVGTLILCGLNRFF